MTRPATDPASRGAQAAAPADAPLRARVIREFIVRFGAPPALIARAPGRVNLIGDHTDYNDGFVLPMAIDRAVWIALRPRDDRHVVVHSLDFGASAELDLGALERETSAGSGAFERGDTAATDASEPGRDGWVEYVRGVAWALASSGHLLRGWDGVVAGDVPLGAGLSSSAALELAAARAFSGAGGLSWEPVTMARLAQRAEREWVGVNCGIMDQLISAAGTAGHAVLIDCRSLETRPVPMPSEAAVVVLDTATRRALVESAYNERRARCEEAAAVFGVRALRDVSLDAFKARESALDPILRRRARHVVTENARVLAAAAALERGDVRAVGRLMSESHTSLRDDFEVSRAELDAMVESAQAHRACFGARMTGAGFGGCAVALVDAAGADAFAREVARAYEARVGLRPSVYVCAASEGASLEGA